MQAVCKVTADTILITSDEFTDSRHMDDLILPEWWEWVNRCIFYVVLALVPDPSLSLLVALECCCSDTSIHRFAPFLLWLATSRLYTAQLFKLFILQTLLLWHWPIDFWFGHWLTAIDQSIIRAVTNVALLLRSWKNSKAWMSLLDIFMLVVITHIFFEFLFQGWLWWLSIFWDVWILE